MTTALKIAPSAGWQQPSPAWTKPTAAEERRLRLEAQERAAAEREQRRQQEHADRLRAIRRRGQERTADLRCKDEQRALRAAVAAQVAAERASMDLRDRSMLVERQAKTAMLVLRAACRAATSVFGSVDEVRANVLITELASPSRSRELVLARLAAGVILRDRLRFTFPEIARVLNGRGHSSIITRRNGLYDGPRGWELIPHCVTHETHRQFVERVEREWEALAKAEGLA